MMLLAKNLVLGYDKPITPKINLTLQNKSWIGIVGPNGSGKSTFFKTILGRRKVFSGSLLVLNNLPGKYNRKIAYIPQERELNLADKMSAYSLIQASFNPWTFGFKAWFQKKSNHLEYLIDLIGAREYIKEPFLELSGGQKKRVYLAQALINQPQLLLLDEPLADLDPNAKEQFLLALKQIHQSEKISLLMISHDMKEVHSHLDGFIHFSKAGVHYCDTLNCIREDSYVGI